MINESLSGWRRWRYEWKNGDEKKGLTSDRNWKIRYQWRGGVVSYLKFWKLDKCSRRKRCGDIRFGTVQNRRRTVPGDMNREPYSGSVRFNSIKLDRTIENWTIGQVRIMVLDRTTAVLPVTGLFDFGLAPWVWRVSVWYREVRWSMYSSIGVLLVAIRGLTRLSLRSYDVVVSPT